MGEHRTPYVVPWWYWCMRFDFVEHYRRYYEGRGHGRRAAFLMATTMAVLVERGW